MPSPSAEVLAAHQAALPDDERVELKKMFGAPCAFVNRQMFFAIFEETLVARVGPERVRVLVEQPGITHFSPSPERTWDDCVQLDTSVAPATCAALAAEGLAWSAALPKRVKWNKK